MRGIMPELPEVETARRLADKILCGRVIVTAHVAHDPIVLESVSTGRVRNALEGARVLNTDRKGKHMWFELDRRPWPCIHFGMTGRFHVGDPREAPPAGCKLALATDDACLVFINHRRLGRIRLRRVPLSEPPLSALGFDALNELPPQRELYELLTRRTAPIKAVLLDQGCLAGIGNWIADEVLYQAHIAPARRASGLHRDEVAALRTTLSRILRHAVKVDADADRFPRTWLFHRRWGKRDDARTARGERIAFDTIGGRTTAWVPGAQA
jgi:formamidopyrimidine-DNA glycosylase